MRSGLFLRRSNMPVNHADQSHRHTIIAAPDAMMTSAKPNPPGEEIAKQTIAANIKANGVVTAKPVERQMKGQSQRRENRIGNAAAVEVISYGVTGRAGEAIAIMPPNTLALTFKITCPTVCRTALSGRLR